MNIAIIIESMSLDKWEMNLPNSLKKSENKVVAIATKAITPTESDEDDSWFGWGTSLLEAGTQVVSLVAVALDEIDTAFGIEIKENETPKSEIFKNKILTIIKEMQQLEKAASNYDCDVISGIIIENLEGYKAALESEYNVTNELAPLEQQIGNFRTIKIKLEEEAERKAEAEAHENSLGKWLSKTMGQISEGAIEQFQSLSSILNPEEHEFLENLKAQIAALLPSENNGRLFSADEERVINSIKEKLQNREKLSMEDIQNLLQFTDRQKKLEDGIADLLKDSLLYTNGYLTKNFVSIVGASIAGMMAGPMAAFAAHQAIGSLWQNYISDANPRNRAEQFVGLFMNGVVGAATGGLGGVVANAAALVVEDEAPASVRDAIAAASIGYLASLTGASTAVSLKVGLVGLLVLKGRQIFHVIKSDGQGIINAIKNPGTILSASRGAITQIAKDSIFALWEKKWSEVGSLTSVVVISFSLLALGSTGAGLVVILPGIYLVNRFFHSDDTYKGGASLTNEDFCQWTARQHQLVDECESQIEDLKKILHEEMDEESYKKTANAIDKIIRDPENPIRR